MKERKDCNIVQDLLPNYIENLTNEDTNEYIENHLNECKECKKVLENMKNKTKITNFEKNTDEKNKVKYMMKYNKRIKIFQLIIIILLITLLFVLTHYYLMFRKAYFKAAETLVNVLSEEIYPETFYASIEEIKDTDIVGLKEIRIKGLNINDKNHRKQYYFNIPIPLENVSNNIKIIWNNQNVDFNALKIGQTISVYNYKNNLETEIDELNNVKMIVILDDKL